MIFVSGRVARLIQDEHGTLKGLALDDGREVRFSAESGELISTLVREGSSVAIQAEPQFNGPHAPHFYATVITNLNSKERVTLPAHKAKGKPGMQSIKPPLETASLAPLSRATMEGAMEGAANANPKVHGAQQGDRQLPPGPYFRHFLYDPRPSYENTTEFSHDDSARCIGIAYDSLHRIQAILAYLHILRYRVPGISQFLDEVKHTYIQALAKFEAADFASAKEFALASGSLARIVEIVVARTLRSDNTLPSLVPPPPRPHGAMTEPDHVEEDLANAQSVLARIHWVLENGTLPTEDRAQVRKIASWGDAFFRQAQRTYRDAVLEDASEFAQAALAGAHSAEHVCRKCYTNHMSHR
ncbi:MAG TPA: hypothetical protein VMH20_11000 [Verrucomicrobiae bacterium]|nr:hypothetical protein [Verrucomicrobiae bacterium]